MEGCRELPLRLPAQGCVGVSFYLWDGFLVHIFSYGLLLGQDGISVQDPEYFLWLRRSVMSLKNLRLRFLRLQHVDHIFPGLWWKAQQGQTVDNMYPLPGSQNQHGVYWIHPSARHGYWQIHWVLFILLLLFFFLPKADWQADTLLQVARKQAKRVCANINYIKIVVSGNDSEKGEDCSWRCLAHYSAHEVNDNVKFSIYALNVVLKSGLK